MNAEVSSSWRPQAVDAQVIAARTYALYQIRQARFSGKHFDVESTVKDQVYHGADPEDYLSARSVNRTRGIILSAKAGKRESPIKAFYHSTCGGTTELPQTVWGQKYPGFARRVRCHYCVSSPRYRWELSLTQSDLRRAFQEGSAREGSQKGWPAEWKRVILEGSPVEARVVRADATGRVSEVSTIWSHPTSDGKAQRIELRVDGIRFRNWLGPGELRSTAFQIERQKPGRELASGGSVAFRVSGRGNGHGVGLCQWGAKVMAEKGHSSDAILGFYYPDAILKKLW